MNIYVMSKKNVGKEYSLITLYNNLPTNEQLREHVDLTDSQCDKIREGVGVGAWDTYYLFLNAVEEGKLRKE